MQLPTRQLGSSDLLITPVGVGTAPIGSTKSWRIYWGHQDERASIRTIHAALDAGVNWIDTAPFYGWGRAEEIVGKAIADRRDRASVFTKCGTMNDGSGGWVGDRLSARFGKVGPLYLCIGATIAVALLYYVILLVPVAAVAIVLLD